MTIISDVRCELGENPLWDVAEQCVYWTDIDAGRIHRFDVATRQTQAIYSGPKVGGFTLQENGELLLFRVDDIAVLKKNGEVNLVQPFQDAGAVRFNDVIADPLGRAFAGTIGNTSESGGLFRLNQNGVLTKLFAGTGCSNGMGFSPNLKTFYWTCTTTRRIFAFDYDQRTAGLKNRRCIYEVTDREGVPDGLTVDSDGCIWSARWGGGCVKRHSSSGEVIATVSLPASKITSLTFGGRALNELFITSAQQDSAATPNAGALFHLPVSNAGKLEFRSKIFTSA